MAHVKMYVTTWCPFCVRAKDLLRRKGVTDVTEINVEDDPALRVEMVEKSGGRRTVPQIWIGERHVGGCDELYELDGRGELDPLLAG